MNLIQTVLESVQRVGGAEAETRKTEAATRPLRLVPEGVGLPSYDVPDEPYGGLASEDDGRFLYHVPLEEAHERLVFLRDPSAWADVESQAIAGADASTLRRHLPKLAARERFVLYLHYGIGCPPQTMTAIARLLGVTRATAYTIERQALVHVRALWRWHYISA